MESGWFFQNQKQGGSRFASPPYVLFLCYFKIGFQGFDVGLEGLLTFGGDAAGGARTLAFEGLFYIGIGLILLSVLLQTKRVWSR